MTTGDPIATFRSRTTDLDDNRNVHVHMQQVAL